MSNACSLSALVCGDQDKTITNFVEQKGIITNFVYEGIRSTDPFIRLLEGTKKPFPEGMGDTLRRDILTVTSPNEMDALNWRPVRSNFPGNSACCNEFREFSYGSRTVHGCLSKIGYKSPTFCKDDIVFKTRFIDQLMQIVMSMRNISTGVWSQWLRFSYVKAITNVILSNKFGHPEAFGEYPLNAVPTTHLTFEHMDAVSERSKAVGGLIGSPIDGLKAVVIGINSYNRMVARRMQQNANLVGARGENLSLPNYQEWSVDTLGKVISWGGYAFILIDKPRRFRERQPSELWEDCIIPSTIQVPTDRGMKTDKNPDYYNPRVAKYEETVELNTEAADWLVPPNALTKGMSAGGMEFFPASNYAGDFTAVHCPLDPLKKTVMFMAEFMGGMISSFPEKARAMLHLATHINACDDDDDVCVVGGVPSITNGNPIRQVSTNATAGQLQVLVEGALPTGCPNGFSLFIESEKGQQFLIGSVVSTWAFAGNQDIPQAGNYYILQLAAGLNAAAVVREMCDPWKRVACLPSGTVSSDPNVTPCGVCINGDSTPDTTCYITAILRTDRLRGFKTNANADTIAVTDYTTASAYQTALQTWLTANGGGTTTVTFTGSGGVPAYEWIVTIKTPPAALIGGSVQYDDGIVNTALAPLGTTGVCG